MQEKNEGLKMLSNTIASTSRLYTISQLGYSKIRATSFRHREFIYVFHCYNMFDLQHMVHYNIKDLPNPFFLYNIYEKEYGENPNKVYVHLILTTHTLFN